MYYKKDYLYYIKYMNYYVLDIFSSIIPFARAKMSFFSVLVPYNVYIRVS